MTFDSRFPLRRSHSKMSTSSTLTGVGWRMGRVREGDGGERRNRCTPRQPSRWSTSWKVERARAPEKGAVPRENGLVPGGMHHLADLLVAQCGAH